MSFSAYNLSVPADRLRSDYPRGWVETETTRRILEDIAQPLHKKIFKEKVASQNVDRGFSPAQIDYHWTTCPKSEIPGYDEQRPEEWSESESETESKADPPTRSQRSVNSRQAGPSSQVGANEGASRGNDGYYTGQRGSDSIYAESPRHEHGDYYIGQREDYYTSGRGLNSIYAPPSDLRGQGSESSSIPWSDPPSSRRNQHPHDRIIDSDYDRSRSYQPPWNDYPRYDYTTYEAGVTPSGNVMTSGNRSGRNYTPYGSDDEYSSGLEYSGSTLVNSHSSSPQGRASRGSEQGRRDSGRAYR